MQIKQWSARSGPIRLMAAGLVLALVAAACGSDDDDGAADAPAAEEPADEPADEPDDEPDDEPADDSDADDGDGDDAAAGGLPPGTYIVGFESLTSGPAAFAGVPLAQGARLALKEINETGFLGEGVELELSEQDAGGDPARAIAAVDRFIAEGASGILCCALSSAAGSVKPALERSGTPGIVTSAILPGLPDPPYMFRPVVLLGDTAYRDLVATLVDEVGIGTAVISNTADNDGMVSEGEIWAEALDEFGVELLDVIDTRTGDTDFAGPATTIINIDPDLVILSMLGEEATLLADALRTRGYEGEIATTYGISNQANYEIAGDNLAGVKFPVAFTPESTYPLAVAFTELYTAEYGQEPDVFAAQGYTSMWMLALGMNASGDGSPNNVGAALAELDEMDSVYGPLGIEGGQVFMLEPALLMEWQVGGTFAVWPG